MSAQIVEKYWATNKQLKSGNIVGWFESNSGLFTSRPGRVNVASL